MIVAVQVTVIKRVPNTSREIESIQTMLGLRRTYSKREAENSVIAETFKKFPDHELFSYNSISY